MFGIWPSYIRDLMVACVSFHFVRGSHSTLLYLNFCSRDHRQSSNLGIYMGNIQRIRMRCRYLHIMTTDIPIGISIIDRSSYNWVKAFISSVLLRLIKCVTLEHPLQFYWVKWNLVAIILELLKGMLNEVLCLFFLIGSKICVMPVTYHSSVW